MKWTNLKCNVNNTLFKYFSSFGQCCVAKCGDCDITQFASTCVAWLCLGMKSLTGTR